jgi:hypothetical protein
MILLFLLLLVVPLVSYKWAKKYKNGKLWTITCASLGAIVCPLAFGIYGIGGVIAGTIPYVGLYVGLALIAVAGAIFFSHSAVGYYLAIALGIQQPAVVVEGMGQVQVELINGIVWGTVYGLIGFLIDRLRNRRTQMDSHIPEGKCNQEF